MTTADVTATSHAHNEKARLSRGMAGMVRFIASESCSLAASSLPYFFVRQQAEVWPPEGVHKLKSSSAASSLPSCIERPCRPFRHRCGPQRQTTSFVL